jgi:hypothetical protein
VGKNESIAMTYLLSPWKRQGPILTREALPDKLIMLIGFSWQTPENKDKEDITYSLSTEGIIVDRKDLTAKNGKDAMREADEMLLAAGCKFLTQEEFDRYKVLT